jgi:hypothetical protein
MRNDKPSPSLVPHIPGFDVEVYLVFDDFGLIGRSYREVDENQADRETLIRNMLAGEYERPVRVVAFNTAEGWSRDVSDDIAREVCQRAIAEGRELPFGSKAFAEYQLGQDCPV